MDINNFIDDVSVDAVALASVSCILEDKGPLTLVEIVNELLSDDDAQLIKLREIGGLPLGIRITRRVCNVLEFLLEHDHLKVDPSDCLDGTKARFSLNLSDDDCEA